MAKLIFRKNKEYVVVSLQQDRWAPCVLQEPTCQIGNPIPRKTGRQTTIREASHRNFVKRVALDRWNMGFDTQLDGVQKLNHRQMATSQSRVGFGSSTSTCYHFSLCLSLSISRWSKSGAGGAWSVERGCALCAASEEPPHIQPVITPHCAVSLQRQRVAFGCEETEELLDGQCSRRFRRNRRQLVASVFLFRLFREFPKLEQSRFSF